MADLIYRVSTTPSIPTTTYSKNSPLTNLEIAINFKSINDDLLLKAPLASGVFSDSHFVVSGMCSDNDHVVTYVSSSATELKVKTSDPGIGNNYEMDTIYTHIIMVA